ncbi:MAG TPA: metallophosphoesterase [Mariprofundaceae bacterium]|nr:metallophosphoesterase [Mariprofundaceae bacterium]
MHRYLQPKPEHADLLSLSERLGRLHVNQRLGIEQDHAVEVFGHGHVLNPENWLSGQKLARLFLRVTGFGRLGRRRARQHRIVEREVRLDRLPAACDGLSLLHLTDLHLDMAEDTVDALIKSLHGVSADVAVLTGDFRARTYGGINRVVEAMGKLRAQLPERCFAILGNHDCLAMVPAFEAMGISMLLNESVEFEKGLFLAGIDDPHYYRVDNLAKAMEGVPNAAPVILLAHSPEIYRQATHAEVDLMLCGHTHGGQVCFPGGYALTYDCHCPRRYCRGGWQHGDMQGYTSSGCGTSILDIRFFCPPEIVIHRLRKPVSTDACESPSDTAGAK